MFRRLSPVQRGIALYLRVSLLVKVFALVGLLLLLKAMGVF